MNTLTWKIKEEFRLQSLQILSKFDLDLWLQGHINHFKTFLSNTPRAIAVPNINAIGQKNERGIQVTDITDFE